MNCHYHSEHGVARECQICHHLVCQECVVPVGKNAVCKQCLAESLVLDEHGLRPNVQAPPEPVTLRKSQPVMQAKQQEQAVKTVQQKSDAFDRPYKSTFLTVLFSCLPGLGHYYLGLQKRGLNLMILFFAVIFLNTIVPSVLNFPCGIAIPILWFYAQFDALKYRTLINVGEPYEDIPVIPQLMSTSNSALIGWALAVIGIFVLFYNLMNLINMDMRIREGIRQTVTAALLLGVGFWILRGKSFKLLTKEQNDDGEHA
jgi:hypothetical protein